MIDWDQRFGTEEFVYGLAPNRWLEEHARRAIVPGGRVLCLGEGEGRNAVWLAQQGFRVEAVDSSAVGLAKAARLAASKGVAIETRVADLADYRPAEGAYDAVVLVYVHLPPEVRRRVHLAAQNALAPRGALILEAFTPRQLERASGGPKTESWLYEPDQLKADFPALTWETLAEVEVVLDEGPLHHGAAMVVRGLGRMPKDPTLCGCF